MTAATWPRQGRGWLYLGQAACLATIVAAGRASAERPGTDGQEVWVVMAVAAAVISAAGNGLWLGTVRRATNIRRRLIVGRLARPADPSATGGGPTDRPRPASGSDPPVMVPGLRLRHRPGCPLVAGKPVVPATADTRPCGWCSS